MAARQVRGFAAIADDPGYPPDLRHLVWREWAAEPGGRARIEAEIAALMPGDPQIGRFDDRPVTPAETRRLARRGAARRAAARHLRASARRASRPAPARPGCSSAATRCSPSSARPSETLIPPEVWNASPRGRLALLRLARARHRFADAIFAGVAAEDQCLAEALAAETARFRQ